MIYDNSNVRRKDRLLEENDAKDLLRRGEFGVLSMVEERGGEGAGYGIPINYVWDGEGSVYFHCAPQGYKLECLARNPKASFCVVGRTNVISDKFTTEYESIVLRGDVCIEPEAEERMSALMLLLDKYSPEYKEEGKKYSEKSFHRTGIMRLDIETMSGKAK